MKIYMGADEAIMDVVREEGVPIENIVKQEVVYSIPEKDWQEQSKSYQTSNEESQSYDIFSAVKKGATDVVHFVDDAKPEAEGLLTKFGKMSTEGKIFTLAILYFVAKKIF